MNLIRSFPLNTGMKATLALSTLVLISTTSAQTGDEAMLAGLTAMKKADHQLAGSALDKAVVDDPSNGKTWYYRAVNRISLGNNEGALEDLDHLLLLEPADVHAMLRRAEVYRLKGDDLRANSDLHRVLGFHSNGPAAEHALFELGRIAKDGMDLPTALGYFDQLVRIAPYNAMAWCDRGTVRSALQDDDNAISDLQKAIDLDPTLDQAYANMGIIYLRQDRKQEGCFALQQARDLGDSSVDQLILIHCD